MKTITTSELRSRMQAGPVALFDVRGDVKYEQGHIPGAKTAPPGCLSFRVRGIMNPDSFIVVYSAGGDCPIGVNAVTRLENMDMTNVHLYSDGLAGWEAAGFEVEESPHARKQAWGEVQDCRHIVVDRSEAYGGIFSHKPADDSVAGG